ncbi:MAG: PEP-CTERM sorting domain-containing protein [Candidatus Thiodiazotropha sp. (ex Lucinoma borealis)]|nr:PEP-CTERM sorting domain-containing protein [Candidatus Thiodiazotropha sp. (ex Lucinoma borealis)]
MNIKQTLLKTSAFLALCAVSVTVNATIISTIDMGSFHFDSINLVDTMIGRDTEGTNKRTVRSDNQIVTLDRFDGSLGDLVDVDIWFESDWSLGSIVHAQDKRHRIRTASGAGKSISRQAVRLIDPNREVERNREVVRSSCRSLTSCTDQDYEIGSFDGIFDLSNFNLSDFIGTDDLRFNVVRTLIADLTLCGSRDSCYQKNTLNAWGGDLFVSYTYNTQEEHSVPEPSSLALLGLGLLGFGASRLRQKKS